MHEIISNMDPAFVPVFVTLRQTLEKCDCSPEIYENDYIIVIPKEIVKNGKTDINAYCKYILKEAAKATLLGTSCEEILYDTCGDYDWSIATMYSKREKLSSLGIYDICGYNGDITKDMLIHRITVDVYMDENLLPAPQGVLLVQRPHSSDYICIPNCSVDWHKGRIGVDTNEIALIYAESIAIDFGNGIKHPVAYGKRNRKRKGNIFFYVPEDL